MTCGLRADARVRASSVTGVAIVAGLIAWAGASSRADEVQFNNGDRLTGTITTVDGGKMKIKTKVAGEVTVDMKDVRTFSTNGPVAIKLSDGTVLRRKVNADEPGQVSVGGGGGGGAGAAAAAGQNIPLAQVKRINPSEQLTGSVVVGGLITRGNSDTEQLSVSADAVRRTESDRITLTGGYFFGRQRDQSTGDKSTTTDNWFAGGKYDYFLDERLYAFGGIRVEKDRIANLDLRVTPSAGLGYQWVEGPTLNFNTEAGIAYVHESYTHDGTDDHIAGRLAYHVDTQVNDKVSLFHSLVYLPSLERFDDYNLIADAGVRATLTDQMFTEFKLQWNYDSTPAPHASRSDLRYILGVGWKF
jgi:putative salt-induced outer membrane protein YdiY